MVDFFSQILSACRRLLRTPAFSLLCILTLAVGIAANTVVFSIVDAVLLSPLPYPQSERLVGLWHTAPGLDIGELPQSTATYLFYERQSRSLEDVALSKAIQVNLTGGDTPERLPAAAVTASLFQVLKTGPQTGRAFSAEDERPGANPVVLLSHRLWQRLGADPQIRGKKVQIDGRDTVVVGVMPDGFEYPTPETDLWLPLPLDAATAELGNFESIGVGRLAAGVSPAAAQEEMNRLLANLVQAFPGSEAAPVLANAGFAARVRPLREDVVGDVGGLLWILLGAVGFILLIACANVANLLVVRGEGRRREQAIQISLGAPRGRLIGAVLAESLALGIAAGAVGLALAYGSLRLLVRFQPVRLPRLEEVGIDGSVLAFTALVSLLTSVLFGLIPALRSTFSSDLPAELKGSGRAVTSGRARRVTRQLLVGIQIALALVLLNGSGLMLHSFLRLSRLDPGFTAPGVLTFRLSPSESRSSDDAAMAQLFQGVLDRLSSIPGVESAGAVSALPLSGSAEASGILIEDFPLEPNAPPPVVGTERVSAGYFEAMGIPLRSGRTLERADHEHRSGAVVVSESLARRYWPDSSALGERLRPAGADAAGDPWYTVVGVVGDVRNRRLTDEPGEMVYYPMLGKSAGDWTVGSMDIALRTRLDPESLGDAVRREIAAFAPSLPVAELKPMSDLVRRARARMSFTVLMFLAASAIALLLGGVGIYGFVSYMVSQRTPEIGVRVAIGARAGTIRWMILKEILGIAAIAIAIGLLGSLVLTRWLQSLLFEVSPLDPVTFATVPLLLAVLSVFSSYLPADRAAHVDPVIALQRYE